MTTFGSVVTMACDPLLHPHREIQSPSAVTIEAWLLDLANTRGACIVQRDRAPGQVFAAPPREVLRDEDLVTAICMLQRRDHPPLCAAG